CAGAGAPDFLLQRRRAVELAARIGLLPGTSVAVRRRNLGPVEQRMLEAGTPGEIAARRQRGKGVAVVGEPSGDEALLFRAALERMVVDRELERGLDRFRAAAGKEEAIQSRRSPSRQSLHQPLARRRNPDRQDVIELADLLGGELGDLLAPLSDVYHHRATGGVEDLLAVVGEQVRTLRAFHAKRPVD